MLSTTLRKFHFFLATYARKDVFQLPDESPRWQQRRGGEGTCVTATKRLDPAGCGNAEGIPFWNRLFGFDYSKVSPIIENRFQTSGAALVQ